VYTLLFYVPRGAAPFKGWSTSQTFTATIDRTHIAVNVWAFGIMEELLLNVGYLLVMPCLVIFGMELGILDNISLRILSLLIPTRLAAIWICGRIIHCHTGF
jgi:hypothetical protein